MNNPSKQIYDPIHGFVDVTPLMRKIIDTPEFQRLRYLKQLGAVQFVYPSATHTRFEHSIGVSHLAFTMANHLFKDTIINDTNYPIAELTRIAGLIHDIGHGPFSHLYDTQVRLYDEPEHEERGCNIFRQMITKYNIPLNSNEIQIIIDMIDPPKSKIHDPIYQIVANKVNQIDVDKIDYIQRDCFHIGLKFGGEWSRLLTMCEVTQINTNGMKQITWPKKLEYEILQLFTTRYRLHRQVYNHHTVKAYEYCIAEILKAERNRKINFIDLNDSIIGCRIHSEYNQIRDNMSMRKIPKLIGEKILSMSEYNKMKDANHPRMVLGLIIDVTPLGFASSERNPIENVILHDNNKKENEGSKLYHIDKNMSISMPKWHKEAILRHYYINPSQYNEERENWIKMYGADTLA